LKKKWDSKILSNCRERAWKRGLAFELTGQDLRQMLEDSEYRCSVTGIPFDFSPTASSTHSRRPFFPSVDRIDNKLGYTRENCRIVCVAANYAMNEWGEEVFAMVARGYLGITSKVKGISVDNARCGKRYRVRVRHNGQLMGCGRYETFGEAHQALINVKRELKRNGVCDGNNRKTGERAVPSDNPA